MKKFFIVSVVIFALCLLSDTGHGAEVQYVASKNGLNLREKKNTKSEILIVIPFSEEIEILKTKKKWCKVSYGDLTGYVQKKYLSEDNPLDEYEYLGNWHITAYAYTGSPCANGNYPTVGYTIACNSLDFGTEVYIKGIGFRTVEDRGPSWLGSDWLDMYLGDYNTCVQFGSQYHDVYLVKGNGDG